jgi:Caspase domain
MSLTRREWLKRTGLLGAGFWLGNEAMCDSQALTQTLTRTSTQVAQTLAQSTPRKLALLVGVDQYHRQSGRSVPVLKGCVTDVELQAELLIHRFGFAAADVLALTDEAATRSNIESSFITHLSEQARPGDIVVFHFSGYGCLVRTRLTAEGGAIAGTLGEQQALVPVDGWIPNAVAGAPPMFNGIYEDTLFLLLRSLLTDRVTTILDTGLQPSLALRSRNLRERALPIEELESPSVAELALQERLLQQTQLTRDQVQVQRQAGQLPGLVLTAATGAQPAALEVDWPEFSAGLFSYGLTQQLWGYETANITVQFNRLSNRMAQHLGAVPQPAIKGQSFSTLPWALDSSAMPQAVGFISSTNRSGQTSKVWLGGLRAELLELYQSQSCFRVARASAAPSDLTSSTRTSEVLNLAIVNSARVAIAPSVQTLVQLKSRRGWTAIADLRSGPPLVEGAFLSEAIRVLPKKIALKLALGSSLSRIERVDATSFISMENKSLQVVGEAQPADYIFTKISTAKNLPSPSAAADSIQSSPQSPDSFGLAYLSGTLLPNTAITRSSVVKIALQRLRPVSDTLLALKLLTLSVNDVSALHISATLEQLEDVPQPLIRLQTPGEPEIPFFEQLTEALVSKADKSAKILSIPSGTVIQYRVNNWNRFPVYAWLVGVNSSTTLFSSYAKENPTALTDMTESPAILKPLMIQPGTSVTLPTASQVWKASNMTGLNQAFLIVTRQPLTQTLAMQTTMLKSSLPSAIAGFIPLSNPLPVIQKLFEDLHQASLPATEALGIAPQNAWALDIDAWASLQFLYRTV